MSVLTVEHVARIEGHGKITLHLDEQGLHAVAVGVPLPGAVTATE